MRDICKLIFQLCMLSFARKFFVVSVCCSNETERWCEISPTLAYTTLNISSGHSEMINCTTPSDTSGSTVYFVNQLGEPVTGLPSVFSHPLVMDDSSSGPALSIYRFSISWTSDKDIHEKLKVVQCAATFACSSRPFKTSVVSINFLDNEQEPATAATTLQSTPKLTTTSPTRETSTIRETSPTRETSTTGETSTTTTADSGCVCTPSQCATVLPDTGRNTDFLPQSQTSQGFKLAYTLNSLIISVILFIASVGFEYT